MQSLKIALTIAVALLLQMILARLLGTWRVRFVRWSVAHRSAWSHPTGTHAAWPHAPGASAVANETGPAA